MSAAVQPIATLSTLPSSGPPPHNPLHHTPGGLALPPLGSSAPVMMPRPPATAIPSLGPSLPPSHQDAADLAEAAPNQDVLLALLARNKNLEERKIETPSCFPIKEEE
ncbi:wiskott-Aldrich syndrome protein homolog 1-like, partial [Frieseomelitta varia]|uniref:wiskott-Aldrich syndrome protein homolog 1-like n=1 Tax=Frieseomelitta varia TaxID=561572 RepID=UPI001CB68AA0